MAKKRRKLGKTANERIIAERDAIRDLLDGTGFKLVGFNSAEDFDTCHEKYPGMFAFLPAHVKLLERMKNYEHALKDIASFIGEKDHSAHWLAVTAKDVLDRYKK